MRNTSWGLLLDKDLRNPYASPHAMTLIKQMAMRWALNVARME
jgi:hypothetical protein